LRPESKLPLALVCALAASGVAIACLGGDVSQPSGGRPAALAGGAPAAKVGTPADWEWRDYLGDPGRTHHSPLAQIDRTNVAQLAPV